MTPVYLRRFSLFGWAAFILTLVALAVTLNRTLQGVNRVQTFWRDDSVVVTTGTGGYVFTHLFAWTGEGELAVAMLPAPHLALDSDVQVFDRPALNRLTWTGRQNEAVLPPVKGSRVSAGFYRLTYSEFKSP